MYRNQQQQHILYSNQAPPQGQPPKKLENPLFEDSPDLNQRNFGLHFGKEPFPRFQETQFYQGHNQQPPHISSQQNLRRQFHTPITNNYVGIQQQHQLPVANFQNSTAPRMAQSEESGGVIGTQEGRVESDDYEEEDEFEERQEMKDDENDIEYIIMNLYSKMKNLEGKYIDLANYYKHELVKTNTGRPQNEDETEGGHSQSQQHRVSYQGQTPVGRHQAEVDQSPGKDSSGGKRQGDHPASERQIINELIEEKKRLEEDMKQMIALRSSTIGAHHSQHQHQQSPPKIKEFKTNIPSQQQLKFLNEQLKEALKDVQEELDTASKKHLMQFLSAKQNEMYQLASKYNLPSQAKNESLGLWYDAKTKTAQVMSDLKNFLQQKQKQIKGNLVSSQINSERPEEQALQQLNLAPGDPSETLQQQLEVLSKNGNSNTIKILEDFRKEIQILKKKQEQHQKQAQKLKQQLKFKDGLIKDETQRLGQLIREVKQGLTGSDRGLLMSGDKNQHNTSGGGVMSPFEKKIATYQKSAELRKNTNERSGSRGRLPMSNTGTNFYPSQYRNDHLNNPQILNQQPVGSLDDQEIRQLRQKTKLLEAHLDELNSKLLMKTQDVVDLEHTLDGCCLDQARHIQSIENLITYHAQSAKQLEQKQRSKSKLAYEPFTTSPASNTYQVGKEQEKRLTELQRNYDQIYQDLRKANEKYLNQKVENNKLKDEVQILQNALEDAQSQIRRLQNSSGPNTSNENRKIQPKTRINRHDPLQRDNQQQPQRATSNGSTQVSRENEELKKRVQELEKECFALTYYQQELQRRGTSNVSLDPFLRGIQQENVELKNKIDQLCIQVQKFMLSMRRLQRAVNNKDKEIQNLKGEFEKNKKILDQMVKDIKEKEDQQRNNNSVGRSAVNIPGNNLSTFSGGAIQQQNHSMLVGGIQRTENSQERPRNKVVALSANRNIYSSSQRDDLNSSNSQLPPKKGVIRPKTNIQESQDQQNDVQVNSFQEQDRFNNLLEEVKNINEERERLKSQIEDLKNQNEEALNEKNELEAKLNSKSQSTQRMTQQLKSASDRIYKLEKLLNDYKDQLYLLESTQPSCQQQIRELKNDLVYKERELQSDREIREKTNITGLGKQSLHVQTESVLVDPQIVRDELVQHIQEREHYMGLQLDELEHKLSQKEEDLNGVKKLLVSKLKEIESSFVELSQDMIEHEQVQQEASKKIQSKQQLNQSKIQSQLQQQRDLERSLEQVVADGTDQRYNEELEQQVDELTRMNEQLVQDNNDLRVMLKQVQKDLRSQEDLLIIKANFEEQQDINSRLEERIKDLQTELSISKKQATQFKQASEKHKADLNESHKQKERQASLHQQQLSELDEQILHKQQLLIQEQEQRIIFQSEHGQKDRQLKQAKSERQQAEQECERLHEIMEGLERENQQLQAELDLIKKLRDGGEDLSQNETSEEEESKMIDQNPREQALHYQRLQKATQKEFKIVKNQLDKLQFTYDELKAKFDQLKQESRKNVEEIMSMETRLFELEAENEKLRKQSTQSQSEQHMNKEQEEQYKHRLEFKDAEIEELTNKMARIVQSNIELTSKSFRLEGANSELSTENEICRNKLQSIELELEMTKDNNERDIEQLQQQKADVDFHLQQSQSQNDSLVQQLRDLQNKAALDKIQLQQEIEKLKNQYQALLQKEQATQEQTFERLTSQIKQQQADLKVKDKQTKLVACLQLHVQRTLEAELGKQLEEQKKKTRERKLVEVLQAKARDSLAKGLEEQEQLREKERREASKRIEEVKSQKEKELGSLKQRSDQEIRELQRNLVNQSEEEQQRIREEYESTLRTQKDEDEAKRRQQQSELIRLRKEQDDLVKSLTERQDQQTKDLIAQKERENQQLVQEIQKIQEDLGQRHQRELEAKEKQAKMLEALQEKLKKDLERKLELAVSEKQQALIQSEQELIRLRQEQDSHVKTLQGKSREDQEKLKRQIDEAEKRVLQKESEAQKSKEEQERVLESINKKKQEEIRRLQQDLEALSEQTREQEAQIQHLESIYDSKEQENKRLVKESQRLIKEESQKFRVQLDEQNQQYEERIKELESQILDGSEKYENQLKQLQAQIKDQNLKSQQQLKQKDLEIEQLKTDHQLLISQLENQSQQQVQQVKKKLEDDHQASLKKKDQEKTMVEKMQEKIREDMSKQIQEKDQERKDIERRAKELEAQIAKKEREIERERNDQIETIGDLNSKLQTVTQENTNLTQQIDELKKELFNLKKQQSESSNHQIRELSDQVSQLQVQNQTYLSDKKRSDIEIETLAKQLKQKEEDAVNLENDLTEAYSTMDEERNINKEEIARAKQELKKVTDELSQAAQKKEKERKDLEMQMKLKESQITQLNEDIEEYQRQVEEKKAELQSEVDRVQKQKTKISELQQQVQNIKQSNEEEIEQLNQEILLQKQEIDSLKKKYEMTAAQDSDRSLESVNKFVEVHRKLQEANAKLMEQVQLCHQLELENDTLKRQMIEVEYSFAKGNGMGGIEAKPENFADLNASSIENKDGEDEYESAGMTRNYKEDMKRLETELEEFHRIQVALENQNKTLKTELQQIKSATQNASSQQQEAHEALENIKHLKSLFLKFLEKIPIAAPGQGGEELLPVLFSMMNVTDAEKKQTQLVRAQLTENKVMDATKKGVLGGIFGKKK